MCEQTENCRRSTLLKSLGSDEAVTVSPGMLCCDVCSPALRLTRSRVGSKPDIFQRVTLACKPRQRAVRTITPALQKELKERLKMERDAIVEGDIGCRMLGKHVVIPDTCIDELCNRARFIKDCVDIISVPGLRKHFVKLFGVIMEFLQ